MRYVSLPCILPVTLCFCHIPSRIPPPFAGGSPPSRFSLLHSGWLSAPWRVSNQKLDHSKGKTTCSNCFQMIPGSIALVSKNYPNLLIGFKALENGGFAVQVLVWTQPGRYSDSRGRCRDSFRALLKYPWYVAQGYLSRAPSEHCSSTLEPGIKPLNTAMTWWLIAQYAAAGFSTLPVAPNGI